MKSNDGMDMISIGEAATRLQMAPSALRYYDGLAHAGMLQVPKYVRDAIAAETRVITDANPLFAV